MNPNRPRGFTLLELTVVLAILAVVTAIAVASVETAQDQARYEATQRGLESIREAVLGTKSDGRSDSVSFVGDIGRLPLATGGELTELYLQGGLPTYALNAPAGDPQVQIGCGWRGPYLRLPVDADRLRDGWGNSYVLLKNDETVASEGEIVEIVRSLGSDGLAGGAGYAADLSVAFYKTTAPAVPAQHLAEAGGTVYYKDYDTNPDPDKGNVVVIRLYGPQNGLPATLAQFPLDPLEEGDLVVFSFPNSVKGQRVLRAYQSGSLPSGDDANILTGSHAVSVPVRLHVNGDARDLLLRDDPTP